MTIEALLPFHGPHGRSVPAGGLPDAEFSLADNINSDNMLTPLFHSERPPLPKELTTLQQARMSDVLACIHEQIQNVVLAAAERDESGDGSLDVPWDRFQSLLLLQRDLAKWLQQASNSDSEFA